MKYLFTIQDFSLLTGSQWPYHLSSIVADSMRISLKAIFIPCYWPRLKNWICPKTRATKMKNTTFRSTNFVQNIGCAKITVDFRCALARVSQRCWVASCQSGNHWMQSGNNWMLVTTQVSPIAQRSHSSGLLFLFSTFVFAPPREYDRVKGKISNMEMEGIR